MVETSVKSRGRIHWVVDGPTVWFRVFVPTMVGMRMYTEGEVKV